MATQRLQFTAFSRLLHWTMAAMILTMLCIGVAMVASLNNYHVLVSIHRPLGITILILVVVRFVNRLLNVTNRRENRICPYNQNRRLPTCAESIWMPTPPHPCCRR